MSGNDDDSAMLFVFGDDDVGVHLNASSDVDEDDEEAVGSFSCARSRENKERGFYPNPARASLEEAHRFVSRDFLNLFPPCLHQSESSGASNSVDPALFQYHDILTHVLEFCTLSDIFVARTVCSAWWRYTHEIFFSHQRFVVHAGLRAASCYSWLEEVPSAVEPRPIEVPWVEMALVVSLHEVLQHTTSHSSQQFRICVATKQELAAVVEHGRYEEKHIFGIPAHPARVAPWYQRFKDARAPDAPTIAPALPTIVASILKSEEMGRRIDPDHRWDALCAIARFLRAYKYLLLVMMNKAAYVATVQESQKLVPFDDSLEQADADAPNLPSLRKLNRNVGIPRRMIDLSLDTSTFTADTLKGEIQFFAPLRHCFVAQLKNENTSVVLF